MRKQTKKTADAFTHLQEKNMIKKTIIIKQRIPDNNIVCTDKKNCRCFYTPAANYNYLVTIKNRINNADNITILRKQTKKKLQMLLHTCSKIT